MVHKPTSAARGVSRARKRKRRRLITSGVSIFRRSDGSAPEEPRRQTVAENWINAAGGYEADRLIVRRDDRRTRHCRGMSWVAPEGGITHGAPDGGGSKCLGKAAQFIGYSCWGDCDFWWI